MLLTGKTAIVTGGSRGIGRAVSLLLAREGANVAIVYAGNTAAAEETKQQAEALGAAAAVFQCDVADEQAVADMVKAVKTQFGSVDILVNNAGICPRASALDYTEEMWDRIIQINEKAVFFLSQLAAKQFIKQGTGGKIINLASMMSFLGGFNTTAYTASKHAVMGLTRVLASEWGSKNINVNALAPGWIRTNLSAPLQADPVRDASVRARIPMGDWGDPSVFKGVAVLLASDAGRYINGATIPVDGGYLTK